MDRRAERKHIRTHINRKLQWSLRLFLLISVVLFGVVIYDGIHYHANFWQVTLGLLIGIGFGVIFARMYKISWDDKAQHITNNIDIYGIVVLILYITFDLSREHLVHLFTHNQSVSTISLALLAGAMYGRVLGSGRTMFKILQEQEIFSSDHTHKEG